MATKAVREKVVAFRLTPEQHEAYTKKLAEQPVLGANSPGEHARKLALDFVSDKLTWRNKKDRLLANDVAAAPTKKVLASAAA